MKKRILATSDWAAALARETRPLLPVGSDYWRWRRRFAARYRQLLGRFPEKVPLRPVVLERRVFPTYVREKIVFNSERHMSVPAWVCLPVSPENAGRRPAVLCCHGHGLGSCTLVGLNLDGRPAHTYEKRLAVRLAEAGYVTIAPDWRGFGERREGVARDPSPRDLCNVSHLVAEWFGYNLLGLDVWDGMRCVDYLATRPEVDARRIGCVGCSFGGTMTNYLTAADPRISAACMSGNGLGSIAPFLSRFCVCGSQTLPGLLRWSQGPGELIGLICPRPLLIQIGAYDSGMDPRETRRGYARLQAIYRAAGAVEKLSLDLFDGCHEINVAPIVAWFDRWLTL